MPLHSKGPKLFVIASCCHFSGKEPGFDSLYLLAAASTEAQGRNKEAAFQICPW